MRNRSPRLSAHVGPVDFARLAICLLGLLTSPVVTPDNVRGAEANGAEAVIPPPAARMLRRYCGDCHGPQAPEAGLDLEELSARSVASRFLHWRKVADRLADGQMPPAEAEQPTAAQRTLLARQLRDAVRAAANAHAEDPGPVTLRRLTSVEYDHSVADLTGLRLNLDQGFVSDAVGGAGFTNVGDVQFMQDSTLERYLAAAKRVADHAMIGVGPLYFYERPGQTGCELSAVERIQQIYRRHGFRTAAGEGGEAYGLDRYASALLVAWQYRHRRRLGLPDATLATLAAREGIDRRFAEYLWGVLHQSDLRRPTAEIVAAWQNLPEPAANDPQAHAKASAGCQRINQLLQRWQDRLGQNPDAKEEARVLAADAFHVGRTRELLMNINWPPGTQTAHLTFSLESADGNKDRRPTVIWRNPRLQFRDPDKIMDEPSRMIPFLDNKGVQALRFGQHPTGGQVSPDDFVTTIDQAPTIQLPIPPGAIVGRLYVTVELDIDHGDDCIVRAVITQREETDQGLSVSTLLANPEQRDFADWRTGVLEFARLLPQISHREPAPSDRDPIPAPLDGSYNQPERNRFHGQIKYHRDDQFLVRNILDDATRRQLDQAWADLLGSYEHHDLWLQLLADKYQVPLAGRTIEQANPRWIATLPAEMQPYATRLADQHARLTTEFRAAEPRQLRQAIEFARRAWRRPLTTAEEQTLRSFYRQLRDESQLAHPPAMRALLTRILMAPSFLYRTEPLPNAPAGETAPVAGFRSAPLTDWEVAHRLSYFLWSSLPDAELNRAAAAGELQRPEEVARQARRMLKDPKSRRLATEFFGQWFGFYQFDRYRGIDAQRFPEFTDSLKTAMYDEAVTLFEHIVRQDRPVREMLFADYTFANHELAAHYDLSPAAGANDAGGDDASANAPLRRIDDVAARHRGGLLGLGAVLTVTSAPLRTSPVKRGDWILRRVLGTPVPPPPADAGSLPGDDVLGDALTNRQRLAAHRDKTECRGCHARIDPLGFSLEPFDPIGRWRETYRDGQPIDAADTLLDGREISGPAGLREHLARHEPLFHRTLATRLVGYAMGRAESIADAALIDRLIDDLAHHGKFTPLVEQVVRSRQFRYRRVPDDSVDARRPSAQEKNHD